MPRGSQLRTCQVDLGQAACSVPPQNELGLLSFLGFMVVELHFKNVRPDVLEQSWKFTCACRRSWPGLLCFDAFTAPEFTC